MLTLFALLLWQGSPDGVADPATIAQDDTVLTLVPDTDGALTLIPDE